MTRNASRIETHLVVQKWYPDTTGYHFCKVATMADDLATWSAPVLDSFLDLLIEPAAEPTLAITVKRSTPVAETTMIRRLSGDEDDANSSASDTTCSSKSSTAQQRYRKRQKRELEYLRDQVAEMSAHLTVLKSIRGLETSQSSFWEKKARVQKLSSQKAAQENARLKDAVEEQLKIAETLNQLLVKRPKLAVPSPL